MARVKAITGFLYEIGLLKRYPRTGWLQLGVRTPESVADHSFRASVAASVIASLEGVDPQRASGVWPASYSRTASRISPASAGGSGRT